MVSAPMHRRLLAFAGRARHAEPITAAGTARPAVAA
jgi:hypothetical protein